MEKSYQIQKNNKSVRIYDLNLLKTILSIQSKSTITYKGESFDLDGRMLDFIITAVDNIQTYNKKIPIVTEKDEYGNLYVTKGNSTSYPCVVSHVDTVHSIVTKRRVYQQNNILFAFSDSLKKQVGIGGDDLVGVFICLQSLLDFDNIKLVFYRNEEIGRLGSRHSIANKKDFYTDCNYILQCDRRGGHDFIVNSAGVNMASSDFIKETNTYLELYDFKVSTKGIATDVDVLVSGGVGISCVNISSGYYNPHSDAETVDIEDAGRTYSLVFDIISNINKKFPHKHTPKVYKSFSSEFYQPANTNNTNKEIKSTDCNDIPVLRPAYNDSSNSRKIEILPNMWDIINPVKIPTDLKCLNVNCTHNIHIDTEVNSLYCEKCDTNVETMYPIWFDKMVVKFKKPNNHFKRTIKEYVYSWYYQAWVEKDKAVWVTKKNLNFWASKEIYEKEWK